MAFVRTKCSRGCCTETDFLRWRADRFFNRRVCLMLLGGSVSGLSREHVLINLLRIAQHYEADIAHVLL